MAFSIVGIAAVLLETFRALLPLLIVWAVIDAILIVYTARRGQFAHAKARRFAFWLGAVFMFVAFISGPALTQSSFTDFISTIDWVLLGAMSLGVGVFGFLFSLPLTSLLKY